MIKIKDKIIGENHPICIIAEIACAHDGSLEKAKKLVDASIAANADCVQFIAFSADETVAPYHSAYQIGKKLEFNEKQWRELIAYTKEKAKKRNTLISAAIQDFKNAKLMKELDLDIYKIHSPDLSNPDLIRFLAEIGRPLILTVGASSFEEVELAVKTAKDAGNKNIILMYGFQNYPTKFEKINLKLLKALKEKFGCEIGYADHTDAESPLTTILPILSAQLCATLLEKHITLNRAEKGTDHEAALNPDEFAQFVQLTRDVEKAIGSGKREEFTAEEKQYRELVKKSIVAASDLKAGEKITKEKVFFLRSKPGLAPSELSKILNKTLKHDIKKFDIITLADLK